MDKKTYYILGTIFIITSGLLYTLERFMAHSIWVAANAKPNSFQAVPYFPSLFTNMFVPIFIIIGVILFVLGNKKNKI